MVKNLLLQFYFVIFFTHVFAEKIEDLHPLFSSTHWGAYVVEKDSKTVIFSHHANRFFIPASLTKLFTAAKALQILGPEHRFSTVVKSSIEPQEGKIQGNLYLVGGADPFLTSQDLIALAQQVHRQGVRIILGQVLVDDSLFEGSSLPKHGEWEDLIWYYAAEQNALSVNGNALKLSITPHPSGKGLANIQLEQEIPFCQLLNLVETVAKAEKPMLSFNRGLENNVFEVKGTIPADSPVITEQVAIHSPQKYACALFTKALQNAGIQISNFPQQSSQGSFEIARVVSNPLDVIITKMNKTSDNLAADLLHKYLNVSNGDCLYDGAGCSRHNLVTPKQTVDLLETMESSPHKAVFINSLPVSGIDGTLTNRFLNIPSGVTIKAKTGFMTGISNLAGWIELENGKQLLFAIYINNSTWPRAEMQKALEKLILHILDSKF